MEELRWKQGTGTPPEGAIITSDDIFVVWQVLQQLIRSPYVGDPDVWADVPIVNEG